MKPLSAKQSTLLLEIENGGFVDVLDRHRCVTYSKRLHRTMRFNRRTVRSLVERGDLIETYRGTGMVHYERKET